MEMFCRGANDTGSPEVQAAVWSVRIAVLENHARQYLHDYVAERKIVYYKDQRRKILRYLKRVSLERYFACLDKMGLPHDLVEAATSKFPLQKTKWPKSPEGLRKLQSQKKRK
jgi:small subunit ribosomal protein S15